MSWWLIWTLLVPNRVVFRCPPGLRWMSLLCMPLELPLDLHLTLHLSLDLRLLLHLVLHLALVLLLALDLVLQLCLRLDPPLSPVSFLVLLLPHQVLDMPLLWSWSWSTLRPW